MFSPFFPPSPWMQALWVPVFLAVWWLGRRGPGAWLVNLALLLIAAMPIACAAGWFHWYSDTMGRAGYTGLVDPERIAHLQLGSIWWAFVISGAMFSLFLVKSLILLRQKATAGTLAEDEHEC